MPARIRRAVLVGADEFQHARGPGLSEIAGAPRVVEGREVILEVDRFPAQGQVPPSPQARSRLIRERADAPGGRRPRQVGHLDDRHLGGTVVASEITRHQVIGAAITRAYPGARQLGRRLDPLGTRHGAARIVERTLVHPLQPLQLRVAARIEARRGGLGGEVARQVGNGCPGGDIGGAAVQVEPGQVEVGGEGVGRIGPRPLPCQGHDVVIPCGLGQVATHQVLAKLAEACGALQHGGGRGIDRHQPEALPLPARADPAQFVAESPGAGIVEEGAVTGPRDVEIGMGRAVGPDAVIRPRGRVEALPDHCGEATRRKRAAVLLGHGLTQQGERLLQAS